MRPTLYIYYFALVTLFSSSTVQAAGEGKLQEPVAPSSSNSTEDCKARQYIFSWSMEDRCLPKPRGGTSQGVPVTLATEPSVQWQALQKPKLSKFERDRRSILAMAGGYRTSFEFVETVGFATDYQLERPYQSWGTEYVYVVEDQGDFISLQHIMVMFFQEKDGKVTGPMVMKHWRQDWQYEDRDILEYAGQNTWKTRRFSKKAVNGAWSQTVYHVDDSPRYASFGEWHHNGSFSQWRSQETWRPLPRREHSVRDDYEVLEGFNHHLILPTGWVHEQENLKLRLADANTKATPPYVAKELGNNRYERVVDFDFSAGDLYWKKTGPFWKVVRDHWSSVIERHPRFTVRKQYEGTPLFMALFQLAEQYGEGELNNVEAAVSSVFNNYVQTDF